MEETKMLQTKPAMLDRIRLRFEESIQIKQALLADEKAVNIIAEIAECTTQALKQGHKVFFAGNGGSFSDSLHLAAEFVGRFGFDRGPLPAITLGANGSATTAIGNDYGFVHVFARELQTIGSAGDVFIGLSTSGNSPNILECLKVCEEKNIQAFGWTGEKESKMSAQCPCLQVPSQVTARIQESHITAGHVLCEIVEERLCTRK